MKNRKKIIFFDNHFAYISDVLFQQLKQNKNINSINDYIKEKAKQQFGIDITNKEDIELLTQNIAENLYESNSDWLREKIRDDLGVNKYTNYLDDLLPLTDLQTKEDVNTAVADGYGLALFTESEFIHRFPLLEGSKVFFTNSRKTLMPQIIYWDDEKHAIKEIVGGFTHNTIDKSIENFHVLTPPNFEFPEEKSVLMSIDFIYEAYKNQDFEMFTYMSHPLYRNEILDRLMNNTEDEEVKLRLKKCKTIID